MRKKCRRFIGAAFISLLLTGMIAFNAYCLSRMLLPHVTSGYILSAKRTGDGSVSEQVKKSEGLFGIGGRLAGFFLGGNFSGARLACAVSGNIIFDEEKPTIIDGKDETAAPQKPDTEKKDAAPSVGILEKNIDSGGGKIKSGGGISINNETSYSINADELIGAAPAFSASASPQVLIYHTHTTESYQPDKYFDFSHTTPDRTTDLSYNVSAVGDRLASELERRKIGVIHLKNIYDYPQYNGSYGRSCADVQEIIAKNPSIKIAIDLHRDAISTKEGQKTKITADIDGERVAQVMLVVGTDELGLRHDSWRGNLKFAVDFQKQLINVSSKFVRPINLRTSRFNGHVAPGAVIIEVGAAGNSLSEAIAAAPHIADALAGVIKEYSK